jgi:hypothetical protein
MVGRAAGTGDGTAGDFVFMDWRRRFSVGWGVYDTPFVAAGTLNVKSLHTDNIPTCILYQSSSQTADLMQLRTGSLGTAIVSVFDVSGSLGLGTTTPLAKLHVVGSSLFNGSISGSSITASLLGTASYALSAFSASYAPGSPSISASYATTASYASNATTASYLNPTAPYTTISSGSGGWITCSFTEPNQTIELNTVGTYNFTSSNNASTGQVSDILLYISHSAATTSSVTFPSTWKNIGAGWPTFLPAQSIGILWLRCIDSNNVLGTFNYSGSVANGLKAWAHLMYDGSTLTTKVFGCNVSRESLGTYAVSFSIPTLTPTYNVNINGLSGSVTPTGSIAHVITPTTASFRMVFRNISTPLDNADFNTASFAVHAL